MRGLAIDNVPMFGNKKTISQASMLTLANILNAGLGFLFIYAIAKTQPVEDFGKYALLTSYLVLIGRITDFGTNSIFVTTEKYDKKERLNSFVSSKIILFIIALIISIVALTLSNLINLTIFTIFFAGLAGYLMNYYLYALFQKKQNFLMVTLLNFLPALIKGVFAILVISGLSGIALNVENSFAIFSFSLLSGFITYFWLDKEFKEFKFDLTKGWYFIKDSFSAGVSQVIYESWQPLNNSITKIIATFSEVGIFSFANKLASVFSLVSFAVFTVLLPKAKKDRDDNKMFQFSDLFTFSTGVLLMSFIAFFGATKFIHYSLGDKFMESTTLVGILIFASSLNSIQNFFETYLFVKQKSDMLIQINLTKLGVLLVTASYLVFQNGLQGLAWANFLASLTGITIVTYTIIKLEKTTSSLNQP